jgi:adenylate cyclase
MIEIERKFLVTSEAFKQEAFRATRIVQGFLNTDPERTVRVRIKGDQGFLTVKGKSNKAGTIRTEWETEIPVSDAEALLKLGEDTAIEKTRFEVKVGTHLFEVDEFLGENKGLIIAEIELTKEDELFKKTGLVGEGSYWSHCIL